MDGIEASRLRRKLVRNLMASIVLFIMSVDVGRPESITQLVGSMGSLFFGGAIVLFAWLLIRPPQYLKTATSSAAVAPDALYPSRFIGPEFPTGRHEEMADYSQPFIAFGEDKPRPLRLFLQVPGPYGIQLLAEKIYWAMEETGKDFKDAKEQFRSSQASNEAYDFLILKDVQDALARFYEDETDKSATDLYFFNLPELNLQRGLRR